MTASPAPSLTSSLLRGRPGVCADLGRDRCFQGSHVLTPPSSPTSYQTLVGMVHTGYLTADSAVLRVEVPKVPWMVICKIPECTEGIARILCLLRYPADLAGQRGDPGFCCEIGREGSTAFCDENAARRRRGKTVQLAVTTQHKLEKSESRGRRGAGEERARWDQRGPGGYKTCTLCTRVKALCPHRQHMHDYGSLLFWILTVGHRCRNRDQTLKAAMRRLTPTIPSFCSFTRLTSATLLNILLAT